MYKKEPPITAVRTFYFFFFVRGFLSDFFGADNAFGLINILLNISSADNFLNVINQSLTTNDLSLDFRRSRAADVVCGAPMITSSPGNQSAGVETPKASVVCNAATKRFISVKLRPVDNG